MRAARFDTEHMCGKNIVASTYKLSRRYTVEATAKNIDKTARTAREMAEAQRDSFEALAENFASAQRRGMGLAEGGLEFVRLQEDNARAAQEFFANGVNLLQLQGRSAEFVQSWTNDAVEVVREQAEPNPRPARAPRPRGAQPRLPAALDHRRRRGRARAGRAQRPHRRGLRPCGGQPAGVLPDAHPGVGGGVHGLLLAPRLRPAGREGLPGGHPAGL